MPNGTQKKEGYTTLAGTPWISIPTQPPPQPQKPTVSVPSAPAVQVSVSKPVILAAPPETAVVKKAEEIAVAPVTAKIETLTPEQSGTFRFASPEQVKQLGMEAGSEVWIKQTATGITPIKAYTSTGEYTFTLKPTTITTSAVTTPSITPAPTSDISKLEKEGYHGISKLVEIGGVKYPAEVYVKGTQEVISKLLIPEDEAAKVLASVPEYSAVPTAKVSKVPESVISQIFPAKKGIPAPLTGFTPMGKVEEAPKPMEVSDKYIETMKGIETAMYVPIETLKALEQSFKTGARGFFTPIIEWGTKTPAEAEAEARETILGKPVSYVSRQVSTPYRLDISGAIGYTAAESKVFFEKISEAPRELVEFGETGLKFGVSITRPEFQKYAFRGAATPREKEAEIYRISEAQKIPTFTVGGIGGEIGKAIITGKIIQAGISGYKVLVPSKLGEAVVTVAPRVPMTAAEEKLAGEGYKFSSVVEVFAPMGKEGEPTISGVTAISRELRLTMTGAEAKELRPVLTVAKGIAMPPPETYVQFGTTYFKPSKIIKVGYGALSTTIEEAPTEVVSIGKEWFERKVPSITFTFETPESQAFRSAALQRRYPAGLFAEAETKVAKIEDLSDSFIGKVIMKGEPTTTEVMYKAYKEPATGLLVGKAYIEKPSIFGLKEKSYILYQIETLEPLVKSEIGETLASVSSQFVQKYTAPTIPSSAWLVDIQTTAPFIPLSLAKAKISPIVTAAAQPSPAIETKAGVGIKSVQIEKTKEVSIPSMPSIYYQAAKPSAKVEYEEVQVSRWKMGEGMKSLVLEPLKPAERIRQPIIEVTKLPSEIGIKEPIALKIKEPEIPIIRQPDISKIREPEQLRIKEPIVQKIREPEIQAIRQPAITFIREPTLTAAQAGASALSKIISKKPIVVISTKEFPVRLSVPARKRKVQFGGIKGERTAIPDLISIWISEQRYGKARYPKVKEAYKFQERYAGGYVPTQEMISRGAEKERLPRFDVSRYLGKGISKFFKK